MAGRGPTPKVNPRRRNKHPSETLSGSPVDAVPALYRRDSYSEATIRWWETWVTSPQAEVFLATDFERLQMLAPLVEQYWESGDKNLLAEIRLNEERLGATVRDRQSLRMTFKDSKAGGDSPPALLPENVSRLKDAFGS